MFHAWNTTVSRARWWTGWLYFGGVAFLMYAIMACDGRWLKGERPSLDGVVIGITLGIGCMCVLMQTGRFLSYPPTWPTRSPLWFWSVRPRRARPFNLVICLVLAIAAGIRLYSVSMAGWGEVLACRPLTAAAAFAIALLLFVTFRVCSYLATDYGLDGLLPSVDYSDEYGHRWENEETFLRIVFF